MHIILLSKIKMYNIILFLSMDFRQLVIQV